MHRERGGGGGGVEKEEGGYIHVLPISKVTVHHESTLPIVSDA